MKRDTPEITIPPDVLQKWQRLVDLLASIVQVPSAVVTKLEPPDDAYYRIVASSKSEGNPFRMGETFAMDIGTYCETVIKSRQSLLVEDAPRDPRWKAAPEIQVGMISYLGFPVRWPDGKMFGTICVLDAKANEYSDVYKELLSHCCAVLEGDLQTLARLSDEFDDQRAHLSELFARVPEALVTVSRECRIMQINPEFTNTFGYTPEEAIGRNLIDLITPAGLDEEVRGLTSRIAQEGDVFVAETVRKRKDGVLVPVFLTCVPVFRKGDWSAGYVIYRDVTESKRLQQEERRYHELQLELANVNRVATLGQLSASIAHELNQPLAAVIINGSTCLRMLNSTTPNLDGVQDAVRRIMRDGQRAADVLARLRSLFGKRPPVFLPMDLNEATRDLIALSHGEFESSGVTVQIELADNLPPVFGDRVQLQQVILNLLRNALDAMSTVEDRRKNLFIKTGRDGDDSVCLSVRDAGVGFDGQSTEKLFEAFYTTKADGMGVGHAVCRHIIEGHGGKLWASLNEGPGATFSFSVPCESREGP